jgi:alkylation response protein AidB-like acyl-CoA dehydrogenase
MLEMKWSAQCVSQNRRQVVRFQILPHLLSLLRWNYSIKGHKILYPPVTISFRTISFTVLALVEGAPAGTKGSSLFAVPQYLVNDDGSISDYNHVDVVGEFEKLGQRGYCTNHLAFGDSGESIGYLVGEENKGLTYMFQMMNEARIATGRMGTGIASAAYYASLQYAKNVAR